MFKKIDNDNVAIIERKCIPMKSYKKSLYSIFLVYFLDGFIFALVFPILAPLLLSPEYGFLPEGLSKNTQNILLGVLLSAFPIGNFIGAPLVGDLADHYGRKKIFYLTIIGTTVGLFLSGWAIVIKSYLFLLIARIITGLVAGNLSLCLAVVADLSPTEKMRSHYYGYLTTLGGISWILAIIAAVYLSDSHRNAWFSPAMPFYVSALLSLVSLGCIYQFFEETFPVQEKKKMSLMKGVKEIGLALNDRDHLTLFSLAFFWYLSWMLSLQWVTPYFMNVFHASQKEIGIFLTYVGVCWLIGGSVVNHYLIKYCRSIQLLFYSALVTVIIFACVPWCFALWFFYLCYGVLTLCGAIAWSNLNNVISLSAGPQDQGKIMGINQAVIALGEVLGPIIGGFLIIVSQGSIFLTCSAFTLVSVVILYFEKKHFIPKA